MMSHQPFRQQAIALAVQARENGDHPFGTICAGAIYWAGICHVVYGCSAESLGRIASGLFVVPCRELFAGGREETIVVGFVMEETAVKVHHGF